LFLIFPISWRFPGLITSRPEQGGLIVQKIDDFVFGGAKELFGARNKIGLLSSFKKLFDFFYLRNR